METPLISVIIPVYKVEKYLNQCVTSVVNQTYQNLEIWLVDDGSPDNCPAMCDAWTKKDARIRALHKENGGLSDARNYATVHVNGKYIAFVDSDDAVHPRYMETMLCAMEKTGAKASVCRYLNFMEEVQDAKYSCLSPAEVYSRENALQTMFYQKRFDNTAHSKMFSAAIAKKYLFPKGRLYEDLFTVYKMLYDAEKVAFVDIPLYYYRNNPGSIMNQKFTTRMFDEIDAANEVEAFVRKNCAKILPAALSRKFSSYSQVLRWTKGAEHTAEIAKKQDDIWRFLASYRWKMMKDRKARLKNRLGAVLTLLGKKVYMSL